MSTDTEHPDPEDMFNDTRMSFGDHIEDLRSHLLRALKGFVVGMVLGIWPLGPWMLAIIVDPLDQQLYEFEVRKLKREKIEAIAVWTASSGCSLTSPSVLPQTNPTCRPRRSSPRAALLRIPPLRRARRIWSSASLICSTS